MENEPILSAVEARVVGALMEKELATPDYYPMTLSGLVSACNQKSNRDPVMELDTKVVERVLLGLRLEKKLVTLVHEAGARVPKYQHGMRDKYGFNEVEQAILAELFLRGPQTLAELRTRTPRMAVQATDTQVAEALEGLDVVAGIPMVVKLPRAPGRRESRYAHQFCGEQLTECDAPAPQVIELPPSEEAKQIETLSQRVQELENTVAILRQEFTDFRSNFE
ncbi:YceH family protein [Kiritimatiellota bacterium B12222]|nr:YceH family protein [Kiritimatiellota bacterium B12222]